MRWPWQKKPVVETYKPSAAQIKHHRNFVAAQANRLVSGWDTESASVNYWLRDQLQPLRSRCREQARNNPYAKRYLSLLKSNVIGPKGIQIQSKAGADGTNRRIEAALNDWSDGSFDYNNIVSRSEFECLALQTVAVDGEFLARVHTGVGRFGVQLEVLDPELLDTQRNQDEKDGTVTRLGVNFNGGRPVGYWFRKVDRFGRYQNGNSSWVDAAAIIHCFRQDWPDQVRGIPWMASALFAMKMLDGYDEAAITAARVGAAKMGFFTSPDGQGMDGSQDASGNTISEAEPGHFEQLPADVQFQSFDPNYPHEQYPHFVKQTIRRIGAGLDINYNSLGNDLEGVNYSSIRAGVLEDRENFKQIQNWLIRRLTKPVYEWFVFVNFGSIQNYKAATYQGRRWPWVDPEKDGKANSLALGDVLKSRSQIMREQGDDPETVWDEIRRENEELEKLGIQVVTK